jgi:amidase
MDARFCNIYLVTHFSRQVQVNEYFEGLLVNPSGVRSLADLIKFNDDNPALEKPAGFEDQSTYVWLKAFFDHATPQI